MNRVKTFIYQRPKRHLVEHKTPCARNYRLKQAAALVFPQELNPVLLSANILPTDWWGGAGAVLNVYSFTTTP